MAKKHHRTWGLKFAEAFRGVWLAVLEERSFRVHLPMAALVVGMAWWLKCEAWEWCVLVFCIGFVLALECMNSALETLFHALDDTTKARMMGCLDRAAGAVLLAAITAAVLGCVILVPKFFAQLG